VYIRSGKLSNFEIKSVLAELENNRKKLVTAKVGKSGTYRDNIRVSETYFPQVVEAHRTFNIIQSLTIEQYRNMNLDFTNLPEIQYAKYHTGGFFSIHTDITDLKKDFLRCITISINLTDSNLYDGGNLIVYHNKEEIRLERDIGSYIMFPSFMQHEVTVITKGTREAIVSWCYMPRKIFNRIVQQSKSQ
jgi:PKHD-type hydroxylase